MSTRDANEAAIEGKALEQLAKTLQDLQQPGPEWVGLFARGENYRHVRHEQLLARWEVLPEAWAQEVEAARVAAIDRTPGAASFGR